ncbi:FAD-binding oxidoreductase [Shewanella canadensis]|uniref:FAD-binding oxidoreductase n=1 Tax=Shewanella canadensis TaxID=271096 RepID=A0A3S0IMX2_9GAMM|nr:FAD-binding oxidoreductase [Shewanella canadensis]RTR38752.1 FAD-binding oxidoreductase [Shewanella canadensis]
MTTNTTYDPLIDTSPANLCWPDSYWGTTVDVPKINPRLSGRHQTDVVIIGAGYTGLITAYYLATRFNIDCCVLEANTVGFGASGRNAGFVLKGSGRLGYAQMAKRWDLDTAKGIYHEFSQAVGRVSELIDTHQIDCDPQEKGYLKIAHNSHALKSLQSASSFITEHLGGEAEFISQSRLTSEFMAHHQAYGAMRLNDGFGLNPLKLVLGYKRMVEKQKVNIFENTCVKQWIEEKGKHRLITEHGEILANKVISAGNAYTPKVFSPKLDEKFLPILSNIIVTEPLSHEELQRAGLHTRQVTMDTRILKYYYRLLPDNRLLLGGRGAIYGKDATHPIYVQRLRYALGQCFQSLANKSISHNWTGWIAAAMDDMPHVYARGGTGYSLGYCGAGVSFSAQAGFRLAQYIAGEEIPSLPLYTNPLPHFPMPRLRRLGQWGYYHYGWLKDRYL